jgi:hypothetical protein
MDEAFLEPFLLGGIDFNCVCEAWGQGKAGTNSENNVN